MRKHGSQPLPDGAGSSLDYFRIRETMTFYALGDDLGVAPVVVERNFRNQAENAGEQEYFFRSTLLRQLYHYVPDGFRMHSDWKLIRAISSWVGMVGRTPEVESRCKHIGDAIQHADDLRDDWLPKSADDPEFIRFFD